MRGEKTATWDVSSGGGERRGRYEKSAGRGKRTCAECAEERPSAELTRKGVLAEEEKKLRKWGVSRENVGSGWRQEGPLGKMDAELVFPTIEGDVLTKFKSPKKGKAVLPVGKDGAE